MASMTDEYYKGLWGWHNLRFVVEMANTQSQGWDDELYRIVGNGLVRPFPELMRSITNQEVKRKVIEIICLRQIGAV